MENKENIIEQKTEKARKELEKLNGEQLHQLFLFFYRLNYRQSNMTTTAKFNEFLGSLDSNPFKVQESKEARKQLIDNLVHYTNDRMGLLTAAVLIRNDYDIEDIIDNYYANVDVFSEDFYF